MPDHPQMSLLHEGPNAYGSDSQDASHVSESAGGSFNADQLARKLEEVAALVPGVPPVTEGIPPRKLLRVQRAARELLERLVALVQWVDPVKHHAVVDPSDPSVAAEYLADRLLKCERVRLLELQPFYGAGVYALYYSGDHPAYKGISGRDIPIYVGKADPATASARDAFEQGKKLYGRLSEHAGSIRDAEHWALSSENTEGIPAIRVADFDARFLVLASAYAGAVERTLINRWNPVWNSETRICYGIGKHGDKAETRTNARSPWDTLHPGRSWAVGDANLSNRKNWREILEEVSEYTSERYKNEDV